MIDFLVEYVNVVGIAQSLHYLRKLLLNVVWVTPIAFVNLVAMTTQVTAAAA
jgi:glycosidase